MLKSCRPQEPSTTRIASAGHAAQNPNMNPKNPQENTQKTRKKTSNFFQKSKEHKALLRDHATTKKEIKFVQHQIFTAEREGATSKDKRGRRGREGSIRP
jgi:hypothetical protein